jgi:bifunctional ADP-heptose synthase (sugar kinase/adenylyltransferase)
VDCDVLLVTRGRNGMSVFRRGAPPVHVPAHGSQDAVDVTGAGDTVAATFSAGLAACGDPVVAARLANVAGALVVQKPGTATVTRDELAAELLRP